MGLFGKSKSKAEKAEEIIQNLKPDTGEFLLTKVTDEKKLVEDLGLFMTPQQVEQFQQEAEFPYSFAQGINVGTATSLIWLLNGCRKDSKFGKTQTGYEHKQIHFGKGLTSVYIEDSTFNLFLLKALMEHTGKGLAEVRDGLSVLPYLVKENIDAQSAEELKELLEKVGAKVVLESVADTGERYTVRLLEPEVSIALVSFLMKKSALGMKEAKDLIMTAPCVLLENVDKVTVVEAKAVLDNFGVKYEVAEHNMPAPASVVGTPTAEICENQVPEKEDSISDGLYSDHLEKIMRIALQDGVLSLDEKKVILARAEKDGEDADEVMMVLRNYMQANGIEEEMEAASDDAAPSAPAPREYEIDTYLSDEVVEKMKEVVKDGKLTDEGRRAFVYYAVNHGYDEDEALEELETFIEDNDIPAEEILDEVEDFDKTVPEVSWDDLPEACDFDDYNEEQVGNEDDDEDDEEDDYDEDDEEDDYDEDDDDDYDDNDDSEFSLLTRIPDEWYEEEQVQGDDGLVYSRDGKWLLRVESDNDLTTCTVKEGVEVIADKAFNRQSELTEVHLPATLRHIGASSFAKCENLETIELPQSLTTIGKCAFQGCASLTEVCLPASLKEMGEKAFGHCENLAHVKFEPGLENIPVRTFEYCGALQQVDLPATLTTIDKAAFVCCGLTHLELPEKLVEIKSLAFEKNEDLKEVVLPRSLRELGHLSFDGGVTWHIPEDGNIVLEDGMVFNKERSKVLLALYPRKHVTLPATVKTIGYGAFQDSQVEYMRLPEGLERIEDKAFLDSSLEWINLPESVTYIGEAAFENCGMEELVIPGSTACLSKLAFNNCSNLQRVKFSEGVEKIGKEAFCSCSSLEKVVFPTTLKVIGNGAFYDCENLSDFVLPRGLRTISGSAFCGCKSLTAVKLPNLVSTLGEKAFANCSALTFVQLPDSLQELQRKTFLEEDEDTERELTVVFPKELKVADYWPGIFEGIATLNYQFKNGDYQQIGDAIYDAEGTTLVAVFNNSPSYEIPEGVTAIGPSAFQVGRNLTSVHFPSTLKSIGKDAFDNCEEMVLDLPDSLDTVAYSAFGWGNKFRVSEKLRQYINDHKDDFKGLDMDALKDLDYVPGNDDDEDDDEY